MKIKSKRSTEELFEDSFLAYLNKIEHFAFSYLKNREDSKNIAQEAFYTLWQNREKVDFENGVFPYLLTITRNKCLNALKKQNNRFKYEDFQQKNFKSFINYNSLSDLSSVNIYSKEVEALYKRCLNDMPDKIKQTFILTRTNKFSNEQVAKILGVSVKTVESRITQGFKLLKEYLKDYLIIILGYLIG